ncbi:MAG: 6-hydroxymethylpterin diphosphokinase MptE-like protein [Intestinibacter sp.]|uniref:6-hydroxymethylpterin diphosphokinase MptE-like protein n=1 Tax=Intestinibacter sp. TaxID=1965304 RepID=UPI003F15A73C
MDIKNNWIYKNIRTLYYYLKNLPQNTKLYFNTKNIKKFHNIHKGQKCFVIGNGPSLKVEDLEKIQSQGYKTFACNRVYLAFSQTNWRPDYYFMSDEKLIEQYDGEIGDISLNNRFFPLKYKETIKKGNFYNAIQFNYENEGRFSKDAFEGVCPAGTVTSEMIQFAFYMGFTEIYLIGVDFSYNINQKNENNTYTYQGENNYFIPNYLKKGEVAYTPNVRANLLGFEAARKAIEEEGRIIKNATRGGKLEVFERIDLDELLNQ